MAISDYFSWLIPQKRRAERARKELRANMEKALQQKKEHGTDAHIPSHRTPRDGMRPDPNAAQIDHDSEGDFTPRFKRSRVARSGDT